MIWGTKGARVLWGSAFAVLIVAAATVFRISFLGLLDNHAQFVIFYPAVILAALIGGLAAGLLATILSMLSVAWFWFEPVGSLWVTEPADQLGLLIFLFGNTLVSFVCEARLRLARRARLAEAEAAQAQDLLLAEEQLRVTQALFRSIMDGTPNLVFVKDCECRIRIANQAMARLLGKPLEELVGQTGIDLFGDTPAGRAIYDNDLRVLESGKPLTAEESVPLEQGERTFLSSKAPHLNSAGEVIGVIGISQDITERKRIEQEMRCNLDAMERIHEVSTRYVESSDPQSLLQSVLDAAVAIAETDIGMVQTLDAKRENMRVAAQCGCGAAVLDYLSEVRIGFPSTCAEALRQQRRVVVEDIASATLFPDSPSQDVLLRAGLRAVQATPLLTRSGHIVGVLSTFWREPHHPEPRVLGMLDILARQAADFIERMQVEATLRESEQRLRWALQASGGGAWMLDISGGVGWWSPEMYPLWGMTPDDTAPRLEEAVKSIHPDDRDRVRQSALDAISNHSDYTYEFRIQHPTRGLRWMSSYGRAVYGESGEPVQVAGITWDITDHKQSEEALRVSEERLRLAQHAAKAGSWEWDLITNENVWTDEIWDLYGLDRHSCRPSYEAWLGSVIAEDHDATVEAVRNAAENGDDLNVEWRVRDRDGSERWLMSRGRPMRDKQGRIVRYLGIVLDITERKRMEQELHAAKSRAEEASKAKDQFLAVLSHELRTPLTPIMVAVSMLEKDVRLNADVRSKVEIVRRNIELESRLIDDLLDVTRIARGKIDLDRQVTSLDAIVEHAVEVCMPDIVAHGIQIDVKMPGGPYVVDADPQRMQQVFWNILKNSVRFTPPEGRISIRGRLEGFERVVIEVSDSGEGVGPEFLPKVFEPFEQADQESAHSPGGLGLGLSISKSLVELHGGIIRAFSEGRDHGTTVTVELPLLSSGVAKQDEDISTSHWHKGARPVCGPLHVLYVEDHRDTAELMGALLEMEGHQVERAGGVEEALLLSGQNQFDVLISDLGLPDGTGLDLMHALRERGVYLPGIVLSGYGQAEDVRRSLEAGFTAHLVKPVGVDDLLSALERASRAE